MPTRWTGRSPTWRPITGEPATADSSGRRTLRGSRGNTARSRSWPTSTAFPALTAFTCPVCRSKSRVRAPAGAGRWHWSRNEIAIECAMNDILAVVETGIYADDLDRAEAFYRETLGLQMLGKEP